MGIDSPLQKYLLGLLRSRESLSPEFWTPLSIQRCWSSHNHQSSPPSLSANPPEPEELASAAARKGPGLHPAAVRGQRGFCQVGSPAVLGTKANHFPDAALQSQGPLCPSDIEVKVEVSNSTVSLKSRLSPAALGVRRRETRLLGPRTPLPWAAGVRQLTGLAAGPPGRGETVLRRASGPPSSVSTPSCENRTLRFVASQLYCRQAGPKVSPSP